MGNTANGSKTINFNEKCAKKGINKYDNISFHVKYASENYTTWKELCLAIINDEPFDICCIGSHVINYKNKMFVLKLSDITVELKINDNMKSIFIDMNNILSMDDINYNLIQINLIYDEANILADAIKVSNKLKETIPVYKNIQRIIPDEYHNKINELIDHLVYN